MNPKLLSSLLALTLLIASLNPGYSLPTDPVKSTTEATDPETDEDKKKSSSESTEEQPQAIESKEQVNKNLEVQEEERPSLYSLSYNFIFYVIYKIKYADIFNFKHRHDGSKDQLSLFDSVSQLYNTVRLLR